MGAAIGLYALTMFEHVSRPRGVHIILRSGIGAAADLCAFWNAAPIGMAERLANGLKERRGELGLTQAELAERVGVTARPSTRSRMGSSLPPLCSRSSLPSAQRAG